ncbi:MAG: restriction endonuclease subunit R [Symploca sp. SIO2E6]|nr:restriction endonuclease subunit R [Symploca sp. SIO2E6]
MVKTLRAQSISLNDLVEEFGLEFSDDLQYFREWQDDLPELTDLEKQTLEGVKANFRHLSRYPLVEAVVKLVVLAPLLNMAGFYRPPFYLTAEQEVKLESEENGIIVTGRLDLLVFTPQFWILIIETKGAKYSLEEGIPQALAYMLSNPHAEKPTLGFVTNGLDFVFLKLMPDASPKYYAESERFSLYSQNGLCTVLRILKRMAQLVSQSS